MIGPYPIHTFLPENHQRAIWAAVEVLTDSFIMDLEYIADSDFAPNFMLGYLPAKYRLRYDAMFAKRFLLCFLTVAWKLRSPDPQPLACTAEELALNAIIEEATAILQDERGEDADFEAAYDYMFEDGDYQLLFDMKYDGIETNEVAVKRFGLDGLAFGEWFRPFNRHRTVHPYVRRPRVRRFTPLHVTEDAEGND